MLFNILCNTGSHCRIPEGLLKGAEFLNVSANFDLSVFSFVILKVCRIIDIIVTG